MCVVSMIHEHYIDKWGQWYDEYQKGTLPLNPSRSIPPAITEDEITEFRRLLERAREYDRKNNEPDCELNEKKETLKKLAKQLGVEIDFL